MRNTLSNRVIWITGASSGIGKKLAETLVEQNNKVIISARNEIALMEMKKKSPDLIHILPVDISKSASVNIMSESLSTITDKLDTIILNAGTCEYIDIRNFESEMIERVAQVNFFGMARCIEASLPLLEQSDNKPHIVGVSSAAAITGLPRAEAYGASKAAVESFLESLALDLNVLSVDVSIVYPGFVDTPLTQKNDFPMPFIMSEEKAVKYIINGIEKRKKKISFPRRLIWSLKLLSNLPASIRHAIGLTMVRKSHQ